MTINTDFTVVFNPANRTLDFSSWTSFDIRRLIKVINITRNVVMYQLPDSDNKLSLEIFKQISFAANILTLNFPTSGYASNDVLIFDYATGSGGGDDVDVVSSVLPTGAAASVDLLDLNIDGQAAQTAVVNNILPVASGSAATDVNSYRSAMVQVVSTATGGTFIFEGSNDNVNFQTIPVYNQLILTGTPITAAITPVVSQIGYVFAVNFRYIRLRIATTITGGSIRAFSKFMRTAFSPAINQIAQNTAGNLNTTATIASGTVTSVTTLANGQTAHSAAATGSPVRVGGRVNTTLDTTLVQGDAADLFQTSAGQVIQKPFGSAENDWQYAAAAAGIVNTTTAVTIKAAGAASIRNFITGITIMAEALGAATELVIRDGAAGTVIFRTKIPAAGLVTTNIKFPTPLKGTAATLLEVATLTASVTGAVYFNAQGYQSL
jgi:hypothetical protein